MRANDHSYHYLDAILVPLGVFILLAYHAQLIFRVRRFPATTVIGVNQINRKLWVRTMMADGLKNGVLAVQTLRNNIMASTLLATAAMMLCSVIATFANSSSNRVSSDQSTTPIISILTANEKPLTSLKLLCIMVCFFIAFLCNVQSVRYYSHASFLINVDISACMKQGNEIITQFLVANKSGPEAYVNSTIAKGGNFWSIGLRAFYFSLPIFLWLFGPVPMFVCSVVLVILLHFLDSTGHEFEQTTVSPHSNADSTRIASSV